VTYDENVKIFSIRQLHATTGKIVRKARTEPFFVTDNGTVVAVVKGVTAEDIGSRPFPKGHWRQRPRSTGDSGVHIADDRSRF
jgi:hypothetical protein